MEARDYPKTKQLDESPEPYIRTLPEGEEGPPLEVVFEYPYDWTIGGPVQRAKEEVSRNGMSDTHTWDQILNGDDAIRVTFTSNE